MRACGGGVSSSRRFTSLCSIFLAFYHSYLFIHMVWLGTRGYCMSSGLFFIYFSFSFSSIPNSQTLFFSRVYHLFYLHFQRALDPRRRRGHLSTTLMASMPMCVCTMYNRWQGKGEITGSFTA
ncbi:hypothetical protein DM02DRAFT_56956 [Periconia macrospinosa]|uniref:Uncharacterized protein n=1 Tax=Periconia macrospinosa TaxID=97972 RepID=A0A2V1E6P6_9PLEO|nr:hypothetical protein DM02DRAFT_56956 [Periconia macrospinosa]